MQEPRNPDNIDRLAEMFEKLTGTDPFVESVDVEENLLMHAPGMVLITDANGRCQKSSQQWNLFKVINGY